jgi:hypothetical protein
LKENITTDNALLYAARVYDNPGCVSFQEFEEDYARVKFIKVLLSKYINNKKVNIQMVLNHIICLNNVFPGLATKILLAEIDRSQWNLLATFLVYLSLIPIDDFWINGEMISVESF